MHGPALSQLASVDAELRDGGAARLSLAPDRDRATSLAALGERHLSETVSPELGQLFVDGLVTVARAMLQSFPGNLFWDLDYPAARLFTLLASRAADPAQALGASVEVIVTLQQRFGRGSKLGFRYAHDFLYGYDWSRWVRRAPAARAGVGPFDLRFLEALARRGEELSLRIDRGDPEYPRLEAGSTRNVFDFNRDPEWELRLHRELVVRDLVPVRAWLPDAAPRHDRPYTELRAECARALGIPPR